MLDLYPTVIEIFSAEKHEQLDYIITTNRWKNSIRNAESDANANIDSDHFPVTTTINVRLKKQGKKKGGRHRYLQCTNTQNETLNDKLENTIEMQEPSIKSIKEWLTKGMEELPKEPPKQIQKTPTIRKLEKNYHTQRQNEKRKNTRRIRNTHQRIQKE